MQFDPCGMEEFFKQSLEIPVRLCIAQKSVGMMALSLGERARYERLTTSRRSTRRQPSRPFRVQDQNAQFRLGKSLDTTVITFPNPCFSLTHCDGFAVAVGVPPRTLKGIGVDLEMGQTAHREAARFFLTGDEQEWVEGLGSTVRGRELRRLWTVKEAVFKSDPANRARTLMSYELIIPAAKCGVAAVGLSAAGALIRYVSLEFGQGFLSIAAMPKEKVSRWPKN
ncbi:MAG: 4'-phosphopantetheinyl transferase superfamily protein [Nitrospiraceae bacterium]